MRHTTIAFALLLATAALAGLVAAQGRAGDAEKGRRIFYDTNDMEYPSCAHCHATVSADAERKKTGHVRPAFPVFNSAHRGAYKNKPKGKGPKTSGDAGNICVKAFQKREKKLPAAAVADLNAFLATISPDRDVEPRKIKYKPALLTRYDGGDAQEGKKKVEVFCGTCHGKSDDHIQIELKPAKYRKEKIAMKVRGWVEDKKKGKVFRPSKGQMSFFATNRLSDGDLLDIIAYLGK